MGWLYKQRDQRAAAPCGQTEVLVSKGVMEPLHQPVLLSVGTDGYSHQATHGRTYTMPMRDTV